MREAQALGISFFAGEAEEQRLDQVLQDAWNGKLAPLYNHMKDLPALAGEPPPILPRKHVRRTAGSLSSIDLGRGCPYQCSFCTIINVQGRKSRFRSPDDLEQLVRQNVAQGINRFFITDDNFARNRDWEKLVDRLIELRRRGDEYRLHHPGRYALPPHSQFHREDDRRPACGGCLSGLRTSIQTICWRRRSGRTRSPNIATCSRSGASTAPRPMPATFWAFPATPKESILHDIEIIKRELPLDVLEFFFLTPLPGSEDHKVLLEKGAWMDSDLNKYDLDHRVSHHPRMSDAEWEEAYRAAWRAYYTPDHVRAILRRVAANRLGRPSTTLSTILWFHLMVAFEGVHPLEGGAFRMKFRRDRRHGLPRENPLIFYPRYLGEIVRKAWGYWSVYRQHKKILEEILQAPDRWTYSDLAIAPSREEELDTLELYKATRGGDAAVAKKRKED